MEFTSGGKEFRLTRSFAKGAGEDELVCLTDGEILSLEDGDLSVLLGGISENVYENTVSVGQLKARTGMPWRRNCATTWQIIRGAMTAA